MALAVVIPAYNEAATIADVVTRTRRQLDWVIVVDDGSVDGTAEKLKELPVTLLRQEQNQGKATALWRGFDVALQQGASGVITLDGDGQHRPEDIPRLLTAIDQNPQMIIIATRLGSRASMPRVRRFGNRIADFWISWASGYPIRDTQSGFRYYPATLLQQLDNTYDRQRSFVFESEILIEAAKLGYYARPVAIDSLYPEQARASHYRPFADTLLIVRMVAGKLLARGLYLPGLLKSLGVLPVRGLQTATDNSHILDNSNKPDSNNPQGDKNET